MIDYNFWYDFLAGKLQTRACEYGLGYELINFFQSWFYIWTWEMIDISLHIMLKYYMQFTLNKI